MNYKAVALACATKKRQFLIQVFFMVSIDIPSSKETPLVRVLERDLPPSLESQDRQRYPSSPQRIRLGIPKVFRGKG
jgi:hypothetical protein